MLLSGIADEASMDIRKQIEIHKQLGWDYIELRRINGKNVACELDERSFHEAADIINESDIQVSCFSSAIGNWSRPISGNFDIDVDELKTAVVRMKKLNVRYIRTMSWVGDIDEESWRFETLRRYQELTKIASDAGICLLHENCTGWAGKSAQNMRYLYEYIGSKNLSLLFDIGNTVAFGQNPWEFYIGIKDIIEYVHIKDCRKNATGGNSKDFTYPGKGDAMVWNIINDIKLSGYNGFYAIEPHIGALLENPTSSQLIEAYLNYGKMVNERL